MSHHHNWLQGNFKAFNPNLVIATSIQQSLVAVFLSISCHFGNPFFSWTAWLIRYIYPPTQMTLSNRHTACMCGRNYLCSYLSANTSSTYPSIKYKRECVAKIINEIPFPILHSQISPARYNEMTWLLILMSIIEVVLEITKQQHTQNISNTKKRIWIFPFSFFIFPSRVFNLTFCSFILRGFVCEDLKTKKRLEEKRKLIGGK